MECIYCNRLYEKNTEHVFPHGLGGEKVFINCVCENCNNDFSKLEGELFQKSPISLIRSVNNLKGYSKKAFFKASELFIYDDVNNVVYEISQFNEMDIRLKPQIIEIDSRYYLEGGDSSEIKLFLSKMKKWKEGSLTAFINDLSFKYVKFIYSDDDVEIEIFESDQKLNGEIIIESFNNESNLFKDFSPRIFLDDNKKIRVRGKTIDEAIVFLKKILKLSKESIKFKSKKKHIDYNGIVYVGQSFSNDHCLRAIVKVFLNTLFHYFPNSRKDNQIKDYISYVNFGTPLIDIDIDKKNNLIDLNDKSHTIFFYQGNDSLSLRLSLFGGKAIFTNFMKGVKVFNDNDYYRIVIDYENRLNRLENKNDIIKK
jgi:hypothetical protein